MRTRSTGSSCGSFGMTGFLLHRIGDPDHSDLLTLSECAERAIVVAGSVADAVASPVEGDERDDENVGLEFRRIRKRLGNAEWSDREAITGAPTAGRSAQTHATDPRAAPAALRSRGAPRPTPSHQVRSRWARKLPSRVSPETEGTPTPKGARRRQVATQNRPAFAGLCRHDVSKHCCGVRPFSKASRCDRAPEPRRTAVRQHRFAWPAA